MRTNTQLRDLLSRRVRVIVHDAVMLGILPAVMAAAAIHPVGSLKVSSKLLSVGDSVAVAGEKFAHNDAVTMALIGVAGRVELGTATTDSAGSFRQRFLVSATTKGGQYRLVAESVDGDEVASVDVVVRQADAKESMDGMHGATMPAVMNMESPPTGEPLQLARARNRTVMLTGSLLIIACLAAGAVLLRQPHAYSRKDQS